MMWFLLLLCLIHVEPVILQDNSNRLILKDGKTPCEGRVEIYHDGEWGYVGDTFWSKSNEEVVCKSAHCGTPESTGYALRPLNSTVWLDNIKCKGGESQLWDCEHSGWNVGFYSQDTTKMVKCSYNVSISLDGSDCAGAVKYSINGGESSGYFCSESWDKSAADFLCKSRGCGKSIDHEKVGTIDWQAFKTSEKMTTKCLDVEHLDDLWQCVTKKSPNCPSPAFVMCEEYERLQLRGNTSNVCRGQLEMEKKGSWSNVTDLKKLKTSPDEWCQQMHCGDKVSHDKGDNGIQVTCKDKVAVVLMNNKTKCYGEVHIKVNDENYPVCGSSWTKEDAEVVCKELSCGKVVFSGTRPNRRGSGIMDNVDCSGKVASLWHCRAKRDSESFQLPCSSTAYVVCGDSLDVRLTDGPGDCAGRVEIQYEGRWQRVDVTGWTENNSKRVCTQVKCGKFRNSANREFSQGSGEFLAKAVNCEPSSSHISECIKDQNQRGQSEAVGIVCEDHKVVFLKGDESCSGMVGIDHGSKTYWLSGSNETWNKNSANTVCRQSHCGEATQPLTSIPSREMMKDVWNESYNCSSDTTSLLKCDKKMTLPKDGGNESHNCSSNTTSQYECQKNMTQAFNESVAYVNCTGKIEVKLTKGCWGNVNICMGEDCGGVCADTWTEPMSKRLCKDLNCGDSILHANKQPEQSNVIIKSVHIPNLATNLNQSIFVRYGIGDTTCDRKPAYVVCSGSAKLKLNSRYKCSGNVEMIYEDQSVPLCNKTLKDDATKNFICEKLNCGHALEEVAYFGPRSAGTPVISNIECLPGGNMSLEACTITSDTSDCVLGGLRCSSWSKTEMKFDKACSGAVFIHSQGKRSFVGNKNLTDTKAEEFCKDLDCGKFKSYKNSTINFLQEQLRFIECEGEPTVNFSEKCGGEVKINNINVCSTHWKDKYSHMICKEKDCNKSIITDYSREPKANVDYYHVTCEDYHHKLGQCSYFKGKCDGKLVSVYCVGKVKFQTKEICGGRIKVSYQSNSQWEYLCPLEDLSSNFKEELCEKLECGGHNDSLRPVNDLNKRTDMKIKLDCSGVHTGINYCLKISPCNTQPPADIYCNGYVKKPDPVISEKDHTVPLILGIGLPLILVILIAVYVRFRIVRRAKKPINFPLPGMVLGKEVEFESGEYDDVTRNEMEDFSPGRFRSDSRVIAESDVRSTSSLPYDDIDERDEAQPLTFKATTAGALGDNYINEGAIRQSGDDVNYEVEDPPENYDDIDASPENPQTKAEVHESPQNTTEGIAVATPGLVPGDKDYLVPGQDG